MAHQSWVKEHLWVPAACGVLGAPQEGRLQGWQSWDNPAGITQHDSSWSCKHRAALGTVPTALPGCALAWFHIRAHWPGLEIAPCAEDYVELKGFKAQDVLR